MTNIFKYLVFAISVSAVLSLNSCSAQSSLPVSNEAQKPSASCPEITSDLIKSYFIEPGIGVGELKIGNPIEQTIKNLRKCSDSRIVRYPTYIYMDAQLFLGDENVNNMTKGDGIRCYFRNDSLFQVSVDSYLYSNDLITKNSLLDDVKRKYPRGKAFRLAPSKENITHKVEDLSYWVVKDDGIAFEFYPSLEKIMRVSNIYIFEPQTEFLPLGTLDATPFIRLVKS